MSDVALPGEDTGPLSDRERKLLSRLLSDPTVYPAAFKDWLIPFLEISDMSLPMASVYGLQTRFGGIDNDIAQIPVVVASKTRMIGGAASGSVDVNGALVVTHGAVFAPGEYVASVVVTNNKSQHRHVIFSVTTNATTTFTIATMDTVTHAPLVAPEPIVVFWQALITTP